MRNRILFIAVLGSLLLITGETRAQCTCVTDYRNLPARHEFNLAYAVFVGKVLQVENAPRNEDGSYLETVHFHVTKAWKRDLDANLTITNKIQGCSNGFAENEDWLVYLHTYQDGTVGTRCCCTRTTLLSKAIEDLKTFAADPPAKILRPQVPQRSESQTSVAQVKPIADLRRMFDYHWNEPLAVKETGVEDKNGVRIHDISYASPKGGRVTAYLVVPPGKGTFAGVIFMHQRPGSRKVFLDEAVRFAQAGAVSLLIDAPFSRTGESKRDFDPTVTSPVYDRDIYIQTVVDLRRGVDLLLSRADVDRKRIGFVGFSYGAHTGAILAGVERRIKAYVIMSGAPSLTQFLRTSTMPGIVKTRSSLTKDQQENYFTTLAVVDPINYIGHVAPAALFLQFGSKDRYPNEEMQALYAAAASNPKLVKTYDAGHELNDEARADRAEWLRKQIKLGKVK